MRHLLNPTHPLGRRTGAATAPSPGRTLSKRETATGRRRSGSRGGGNARIATRRSSSNFPALAIGRGAARQSGMFFWGTCWGRSRARRGDKCGAEFNQ